MLNVGLDTYISRYMHMHIIEVAKRGCFFELLQVVDWINQKRNGIDPRGGGYFIKVGVFFRFSA